MASGSSLHEDIAAIGVDYKVRDPALYDLATSGKTPAYIKDPSTWIPVEIGGKLTIYVCPDYWGYGDADDVFRDTGSPYLAQRLADLYNAVLPTQRLLRAIQQASAYHWGYQDIKGKPYFLNKAGPPEDIQTEEGRVACNEMANKLFSDAGATPGEALAIGYRKAIVVGPNLDGSHVAIAGSSWNGQGTDFVQPYSIIHVSSYVDCSHGIVLISRDAILDGSSADLATLIEAGDPLVTDQAFAPFFPNAGAAGGTLPAFGTYSVDRGGAAVVEAVATVANDYVAPGDPFGDSATRAHAYGGSGEMKTAWEAWAALGGAMAIGGFLLGRWKRWW